MPKNIIKLVILTILFFGMPILGVLLSGRSIETFLHFPPTAHYVKHSPFSWTAFISLSIFCLVTILPIVIPVRHLNLFQLKFRINRKIPSWGKVGIISMIFFWIIAWGKFDIFAKFQVYSFLFLWLSYIVTINGLQFSKTGKCMITGQTGRFLLLFPASAIFWWYFEYINEFIQNWYYIGTDSIYSEMEIFLLSTLSFSTVLPAVSSTCDLLLSGKWIKEYFTARWIIKNPSPKASALSVVVISCSGLAGISIFPEYLFLLVWVSPLLIFVSFQILFNERTILSGIENGNWSLIISAALAALMCGIFWEMWNFYSLPKWQYSIPYVHRFLIFEMPILGFWGYFPFGLLCVAVSKMIGITFDENS